MNGGWSPAAIIGLCSLGLQLLLLLFLSGAWKGRGDLSSRESHDRLKELRAENKHLREWLNVLTMRQYLMAQRIGMKFPPIQTPRSTFEIEDENDEG